MTAPSRRQRGFTLIELVVALTIVAVIAAVALPSYRKRVLKANRQNGIDCVIEGQKRIENYYSRFNKSINSLDDAKVSTSCFVPEGKTTLYTLNYTAPASGSTAYALTATGVGRQAQDGAIVLIYNPADGSMQKQHITPKNVTVDGWQFNPGQ